MTNFFNEPECKVCGEITNDLYCCDECKNDNQTEYDFCYDCWIEHQAINEKMGEDLK